MRRSPISLFLCPSCEADFIGVEPVATFECPRCRYRFQPRDTLFGEVEWANVCEPALLKLCLKALNVRPSLRKARLIPTTVARIGFDPCDSFWFQEAVNHGECEADAVVPTRTKGEIVDGVVAERSAYPTEAWGALAIDCINCGLDYRPDTVERMHPKLVSDAYRELFPNSFLPLAWNPDWFTSTVRDLARTMYGAREFGAMPILADALQDAGCDDEQILTHCRGDKPHARGCWVLDTILGRE